MIRLRSKTFGFKVKIPPFFSFSDEYLPEWQRF